MHIRLRMIFTLALLLGLMASQVFITLDLVSHLALTFDNISQKQLVRIEKLNLIHRKLLMTGTDPAPNLSDLEAAVTDYMQGYQDSPEELTAFLKSYREFKNNKDSHNLMAEIDKLRDAGIREVREGTADNSRIAAQTFYLLSVVVCLVTITGILFGWYVARSYSKSLKALIMATNRVARGDFSQPVQYDYPDEEFGSLAKSFNHMMQALRKARQETERLHEQALETRDNHIQRLQERLNQSDRALRQ